MNASNQTLELLGGLTPQQFLTEYWQKKPLLIKNAIPNFRGLLSPDELAGLACEEDVQARIVEEINGNWQVKHGPFDEADFAALPNTPDPKHRWTLLVQSVNHYLQEATDLLQQFDFIPHARLDDLMVSYAPDGGGVGPHFDSYDVFLLQGQGKRLWRISEQTDLSIIESAPLRILKQFDTAQEWLLEAGDMLYLPPHLAHWGIAVSSHHEDCMTYSIGFRAPKHDELAAEFLGFMQDKLHQDSTAFTGIYQDADLRAQVHPAEISPQMIHKVNQTLQNIRWSETHVAEFLGTYLSSPKQHVIFDLPKKLSKRTFYDQLNKFGIQLDAKTQMLFVADTFFINGEAVKWLEKYAELLQQLADERKLIADTCQRIQQEKNAEPLLALLHTWYAAGYLRFN